MPPSNMLLSNSKKRTSSISSSSSSSTNSSSSSQNLRNRPSRPSLRRRMNRLEKKKSGCLKKKLENGNLFSQNVMVTNANLAM